MRVLPSGTGAEKKVSVSRSEYAPSLRGRRTEMAGPTYVRSWQMSHGLRLPQCGPRAQTLRKRPAIRGHTRSQLVAYGQDDIDPNAARVEGDPVEGDVACPAIDLAYHAMIEAAHLGGKVL